MIKFYILLAGIVLALTISAMWAVRYVATEENCKRLQRLVAVFNILSTVAMGCCWGNMNEIAGIILHALSVLIMIESLLVGMVFVSVGMRTVRRLISSPLIAPVDEGRRRLLKGAVLYPTVATAASLYGGLVEKDDTVVNNYEIHLQDKAHGFLRGYRIIQLSDVHCGPFLPPDKLGQLLEKATGLEGDLLVITGDIFDDNETNEETIGIVNNYCDRFRDGIIFIYGNHEYFRNMPVIEDRLSHSKIKVLRNNAICIAGKAGTEEALYIAGVDYPRHRDTFDQLVKEYTEEAYRNIPKGAASVMLSHHPDFIDEGAAKGANAVLCGHTHGGQIGLFGVPLAPNTFKYMRGVYMVEGRGKGKTLGYVHCGNGSWFPFRLGCPPEIAVFTLTD